MSLESYVHAQSDEEEANSNRETIQSMIEVDTISLNEAMEIKDSSTKEDSVVLTTETVGKNTNFNKLAKELDEKKKFRKTQNNQVEGHERNRNEEFCEVPILANITLKKAAAINTKLKKESIQTVKLKSHEFEFCPENEQVKPGK